MRVFFAKTITFPHNLMFEQKKRSEPNKKKMGEKWKYF